MVMRFAALSVILLLSLNLFSQKLLRYEGSFPNNRHEKATANYSYYIDGKSGQKVKHGSFRYLVKIKGNQNRLYRNITGEFKNGWKVGLWNYSVSAKDYNLKNDGWFYTVNIVMEGNYENGLPVGEWTYTSVVKRRKGKTVQGKKQWEPYEELQDMNIVLHYDKGLLVNSLVISDRLGISVSAMMDDKGFLTENFAIKTKEREIKLRYQEGFALSLGDGADAEQTKADIAYYESHRSDIRAAGIQVDTLSLFQNKDCVISKVLNLSIYNDDDFNYSHIGGDRLILFRGSRKSMEVDYKGLYYRNLSPFISKEEEGIIQSVYSYRKQIKQKLDACKRAMKASGNDVRLQKIYYQLEGLNTRMESYVCQLKVYRKQLSPPTLAVVSQSCRSDINLAKAADRRAILNAIYSNAKKIRDISRTLKCD